MNILDLKTDELIDWLNEQKTVYAKIGKLKLYFTYRNTFEVHNNGEIVWTGTSPEKAVKEFNSYLKQ